MLIWVNNDHFTHYLPNTVPQSMHIEPMTPSMVLNVTLKLKSKLSCGHDEISSKLLKQTTINIITPLTHIINISFETGIVPNQLKIAKCCSYIQICR